MTASAPLEGRVVLVTGAARGIGRGAARAAATRGARVVTADVDGEGAAATAREVEAPGRPALSLKMDVADEAAVRDGIRRAAEEMGRLDGLVCNAGVIAMAPALETGPREWRRQFAVNVDGLFACCRAAARRMIDGGRGGAIVNVASNAGKVGYPNMAAYNATKAAVINLTRSLAGEWAPHGINVNAVCPGGVDTPMLERVAGWLGDRLDREPDELLEGMGPPQLGRLIEPVEVGRVIAFLLSDDARIIRGQAINVDGGDTPY